MMDGKDIDRILSQDIMSEKMYQGVFPVDALPLDPPLLHTPACFVINTDKASGPGEHWQAVYIGADHTGQFFDSYGLPPMDPLLLRFLKRHCMYYVYNERMLQSLTSPYCGYYCVYFVMMKARGQSLSQMLRPFDAVQPWYNDRFICQWFETQSIHM